MHNAYLEGKSSQSFDSTHLLDSSSQFYDITQLHILMYKNFSTDPQISHF